MNVQDRLMIFKPHENMRFVVNFKDTPFTWSGENIGDVTEVLNVVPAVKGNKLFYMSPANQYVILRKYDGITHTIELLKRIFEMKLVPYNLCFYKKKSYIMYLYAPFNEIEYSFLRKKSLEITNDEKKIFFFHWLLGVKGKTLKVFTNDGGYVILSNGRYSDINYIKNNINDRNISKIFGDYQQLYNISEPFKDENKINSMYTLMYENNNWWFQEIKKRLDDIVVIGQPI